MLTVAGTTCSSVGWMIQKSAHNLTDEEGLPLMAPQTTSDSQRRKASLYFLSAHWLLGISVFLLGQLLCWAALAYGTQVVLSPASHVWSIIVTFAAAPVLLREKVDGEKIMSLLIISVGVALVILFGPRSYEPYTVELFKQGLDNSPFWCGSAFALLCLAFLGLKAVIRGKDPWLSSPELAALAAVTGWYSVLLSKCSSGLVQTSLTVWVTWVVVISNVMLAMANVHFLNMAMKNGDAVLVLPMYESLALLGQIALGGIFFGEFDDFASARGRITYWTGVFIIIMGILRLNYAPSILWPKRTSEEETSTPSS